MKRIGYIFPEINGIKSCLIERWEYLPSIYENGILFGNSFIAAQVEFYKTK